MSHIRAIIKKIKSDLTSQGYQVGDYTPTLRALAKIHGVSPETIRNALLEMCREGTVKSLSYKGYVLTKTFFEQHADILPIAFVTDKNHDLSNAQNVTWACSSALLNESQLRGLPLISLHLNGLAPQMVRNQFQNLSLSGIIVDAENGELVQELLDTKLPIVAINSWVDFMPYNTVVQDNYYGSFKAVQFLKQKNLTKIAWVGLKASYNHIRERYAGYRDGVVSSDVYAPESFHIVGTLDQIKMRLTELLGREDRPDAILAFGPFLAQAAIQAVKANNLVLGKDVHIVGWSVDESKQTEYLQYFDQTYQPFMVTWKASDMAKAAIDQILKLKDQPDLLYRINIPTSISGG